MPTRQPAVVTLLISRIDSMENALTKRIDEVQNHLAERIDGLTERVKIQNSRIAKCEDAIHAEEVEVKTALASSRPPADRKQIALIGGSGLLSGAALVELVKYLLSRGV